MGLKALMNVAGVKNAVVAYTIAFMIGPRLNAVGRLDSAQVALDLLLSDDARQCADWADELDRANRERQYIKQKLMEQISAECGARFEREQPFALVADGPGWHPDVIGIVAARLCRQYYRPVVVLSLDDQAGIARGSCRGIEDFDVIAGLHQCVTLMERYGGHAMAAGLSIRAERIEEFRRKFNDVARRRTQGEPPRRKVRIDAEVNEQDLNSSFIDAAALFEPCGTGNPKPVWAACAVQRVSQPRILKEKHLQFTIRLGEKRMRALGFNLGMRSAPEDSLDLAFELVKDDYWGFPQIALRLIDFRPHEGQGCA